MKVLFIAEKAIRYSLLILLALNLLQSASKAETFFKGDGDGVPENTIGAGSR